MFTTTFLKQLLPALIFLALIGIALILKRILPADTTIHLSKPLLIGLVGGGLLLAVLLTAFLFLILKT